MIYEGWHVYVDGSYDPSGNRGGWGFVAYNGGVEVSNDCGPVTDGDNGTAELVALLRALHWIAGNAPDEAAVVFSDSAYIVNGCNQWRRMWRANGWRRSTPNGKGRRRAIPYAELWQQIDAILSANPQLRLAWCKGHATTEGNLRADALASVGRQSSKN